MFKLLQKIPKKTFNTFNKRMISNGTPEDYAYVSELVKKNSWDNYYVSFMMPESLKVPYIVFQGYNIHISQSLEQAHGNQMSARVRLQWWREKVDDMVNERFMLDNPILKCVCDVYNDYLFNPIYLDRMIEAREMDMNQTQPKSIQELYDYGENVFGSIFHMLAQCYGVEDDEALTNKINCISQMMSLSTFLRALPFHFAQRRTYLPKDLCDAHNMTEQECYDGTNEKAMKVISDMNTIAIDKYKESKKIKCSKEAKSLFRACAPNILYCKSLKRHSYDVYDPSYLGQYMRTHVQLSLLNDKLLNKY